MQPPDLITQQDTTVTILDRGKPVCIDYRELVNFHRGDSWFGCSIGFRAMQMAARAWPQPDTWSRGMLSILSRHPGPGVRDAIELVTNSVSSGNYHLPDDSRHICHSRMKFEWTISNAEHSVNIKLLSGIVPDSFLQCLDRINANDYPSVTEKQRDTKRFRQFKSDLSQQIWQLSLDELFDTCVATLPLHNEEKPLC